MEGGRGVDRMRGWGQGEGIGGMGGRREVDRVRRVMEWPGRGEEMGDTVRGGWEKMRGGSERVGGRRCGEEVRGWVGEAKGRK